MKPLRMLTAITGLLAVAVLSGCGSDSGSGDEPMATGALSLGVTDAPVDDADSVVVRFNGVEVKPQGRAAMTVTFTAPKDIDLLDLHGGTVAPLIVNETVPAGNYEWVRLLVTAEFDNVMDSYIDIRGSRFELRVPSGSESGLKLISGFVVPQGGNGTYTIDFDLRKSVVDPGGQPGYFLKPVLRMVDNTAVGGIAGSIDPALIAAQCEGTELGAVYVFSGADAVPDDVDGAEAEPLASGMVEPSGAGFAYQVAFLPAGAYTVAYTCDAAADFPESSETLDFFGAVNATVVTGTTTTVNFTPAVPTAG